jgi:hypothetical protein
MAGGGIGSLAKRYMFAAVLHEAFHVGVKVRGVEAREG